MLETLLSSSSSSSITLINVLTTILIAFLSGGIISFTYMKTYPKNGYSQNFALTIILLPAVIAIIILLIGSDIAAAFSLAGAFSIIRFRSAPGEPKDIAFVLFSLAAGLAAGMSAYLYAMVFTVILCVVMFVLHKVGFAEKKLLTKRLQITVPEDLDYELIFEDLLEKYTVSHELKRVKTTALGSLYQLTFDVVLKEDTNNKAFIDEIRCRNGNLNISLNMVTEPIYE